MKKRLIKIFTILGTSLAVIAILNKFISLISDGIDKIPVKNTHYFKSRFGLVRYIKIGSGKPLILLHDMAIESSSYEWNHVIDSLSEQYTVYAIDLPGFGLSDRIESTYTFYHYYLILNSFIKKTIGEKVTIITSGLSFGLVVQLKYSKPNLIDQIIGINPHSIEDYLVYPCFKKKIMKFILDSPVIGTFIYNIIASKPHITNKMIQQCNKTEHLNSKEIDVAYYNAHITDKNKFLYSNIKTGYLTLDIRRALHNISDSTSIILGEADPNFTNLIREYKKYNSDCIFYKILEAASLPHIDNPKDTVDTICHILQTAKTI